MVRPADSLSKEIETLQRLLQLLKQEETCLVSTDVEGLSKLTLEKANLAAQMSELAKRRHNMLQAAGFKATDAGMDAWLASPAAIEADRNEWNELLSLAQTGKELNRVNGLLIAQHLACNQNALNALQGNAPGGEVYGPNGQPATKIGGRRLVIG
jgi:flagella synthesis protein FlgN